MAESSMLKNYRGAHYDPRHGIADGCSCHNSRNLRRAWKRSAKQSEKKGWKRDQM